MMQRIVTAATLVLIVALATGILMLLPPRRMSYADEPSPTPEQLNIVVIALDIVPTPTPSPAIPAPATPVPTVRPELPDYEYESVDARCLSRAIWSITPAHPTYNTKLALCEVVQNRVDDTSGVYMDDVRSALLQPGEFLDYDPDAYRSETNNAIADYSMRSWAAAQLGDRSYRLTPETGTVCNFYRARGWDFIQVFDRDGNLVYDSGEG